MKTILALTDFSDLSKVAMVYAAKLAMQLKARIILLSVVNANATSQTLLNWKKLEEEMLQKARQDADNLIEEIKGKMDGLDIKYEQDSGFPFELIVDRHVSEDKIDLIVMGCRGETGLRRALLGSSVTAVIDHSAVPVVAVPEGASYGKIKKIVYATDMINLQEEIGIIVKYAKLLGASIAVLHVAGQNSVADVGTGKLEKELIAETKYKRISVHVIKDDNITETVDAFFVSQQGDMLAMFTHRLDFFEKFFGRSVTQQMAFHAHAPLLAFNKTMIKGWQSN